MKIHTFERFLEESNNPCWSGYKQIGTKMEKGKKVPNCVPIKESDDDEDKTYTFDELSKEAQQKAIEREREYFSESDDEWWDPIIEGIVENMEEIGLTDVKVEFSGFYSQGDGASFTGKVSDNKKFLEALGINPFETGGRRIKAFESLFQDFCDNIYISIFRKDSRYFHYNTIDVSVEVDGDDEITYSIGMEVNLEYNVDDLCRKIEPQILDWAKNKSKEIYSDLEKYHDEQMSDEYIADTFRENETEFDSEGNIA